MTDCRPSWHTRLPFAAVSVAALLIGAPKADAQTPWETTAIADGVWQFRWQSHNAFVVEAPDGVVVVDPISADAARALGAEVRRLAPGKDLVHIVYSHDHADHATGADVLRDALAAPSATVIAHENAVPRIDATASAALSAPDVTFARRMVIDLGRRIEMHYLGRSHSDNMVVTFVPDVGVAFAVDFVSADRLGYQDLPDYHFPDFFAALTRLLEIPFETIVFGHGPPGDRETIHRQIAYYDDLRSAVRQALEDGWSEERAAAEIRLPEYESWGQYDAWLPENVRGLYRWMAGDGG